MPDIRVVDVPVAAPGACKLCGSSEKEWFIDMGHSEEFHGVIYYCSECIGHIAAICGFGPPVVVEKLKKEVEFLANELFDYRARYEGIRSRR